MSYNTTENCDNCGVIVYEKNLSLVGGRFVCPSCQDDDNTEQGFEHDGIWIEDITKTPCGRVTLTTEQSADLYSQSILKALKQSIDQDCEDWLLLDAVCGFVQNAIGISDGGNAGLFWSGYEDGIEELVKESQSNNILDSIPDAILLEYIKSEIAFYYSEILA